MPLMLGAVEREARVHEGLGQHRRVAVERASGEVVLPGRERLALDQRGQAGDGGWLPHDERAAASCRPAALKKAFQSMPGAFLSNSFAGHGLLPLETSSESARLAWAAAIFFSSAKALAARLSACFSPASVKSFAR